ncbi:hypothetical protein [Flindersiella endophytica]
MSTLEIRYRRLLAWYPQDHRDVHEDDMLGVLLAAARPGQRRPTLGERADLIRGAFRLHARRAFGRGTTARWRDSAAVVCVVSTLLFLLRVGSDAVVRGVQGPTWIRAVASLVLSAVLLLAILAGIRLLAVPIAVLLSAYVVTSYLPWLTLSAQPGSDLSHGFGIISYSFYMPMRPIDYLLTDAWALLPLVAAVAGAVASNPRRGIITIGLRRLAIWTALVAGTMAWGQALPLLAGPGHIAVQILPFIAVCATACGLSLSSARGRRCVVVFVPLLALFTAVCVDLASIESPWWLAALPAAVAVLTISILAWIQLRHRVHSADDVRTPESGVIG